MYPGRQKSEGNNRRVDSKQTQSFTFVHSL